MAGHRAAILFNSSLSATPKKAAAPSKRLPFPVPVLLLVPENLCHHLCPSLKPSMNISENSNGITSTFSTSPTRIRLIRRVKIKDCTDYGKNPVKTEEGKYISACECDPATVDAEFLLWKSRYKAAKSQGCASALAISTLSGYMITCGCSGKGA